MTTPEIKLQLLKYLNRKQIDTLIKEINETRTWHDPFFRKRYLNRRLYKILKTYEKSIDSV